MSELRVADTLLELMDPKGAKLVYACTLRNNCFPNADNEIFKDQVTF